MNAKWIALLVAMALLLLAGCLGADDVNLEGDENENRYMETAPEASLNANLTEGVAPLQLTFRMDGDHPDPANLSWVLDTGDGNGTFSGKELPFMQEHVYAEAGNYTATLTLSHVEKNTTVRLDVGVEAAEEVPSGVIQEYSGGWEVGVQGCADVHYMAVTEQLDHYWVALERDSVGADFRVTFESTVPAVLYGVTFSGGGNYLETHDSDSSEIEGTVPSGADFAIVWTCGGADVSFDYTATL